jgi:hypothetical protein
VSVEDRLRTATRARADLVRDIPPLDLPARKPVRLPRVSRARWSAWMAPVTAAAVVVALAITLVSLRAVRNEPPVSPGSGQSGTSANSAAVVPPKYYAALYDPLGDGFNAEKDTHPVDLAWGPSTRTTQPMIAPPPGQTFAGVTAAADGRTFVVAAESFPVPTGLFSTAPVAWYLFRIGPGSKAPTLTKLSIPGQPAGTQISGLALSPDGSELAVMFQRGVWTVNKTLSSTAGPLTLSVYSVSTGKALRTWTQPTNGSPAGYGWDWDRYINNSITWLADGRTLAFAGGTYSRENAVPQIFSDVKVRTIDLASPGGDLLADSQVVFSSVNRECDTLQLTADGKTVVCGTFASGGKKSSAYDPEILEYSVATGESRLVYRLNGVCNFGMANVLWMSADGSTLIGSLYSETFGAHLAITSKQFTGLITKGTRKPINLDLDPALVPPVVNGEVAF